MTTVKNEINTYFGRCRCCLSYDYLKNMWEEYHWKGEKEIYAEMLVQCFALSWDQSDVSTNRDQICESCITRLRDAHKFKKTILESQVHLLDKIEEADDEYDDMEYKDPDDYEEDGPDDENSNDYLDTDETKKMKIEYLEDEDSKEAVAALEKMEKMQKKRSKRVALRNINKSPKKLLRTYTEEDLQECLQAVRNGKLSLNQASDKFNISKITIFNKLKFTKENEEKMEFEKELHHEKRMNYLKEMKLILTFTNATPYKSHSNTYCCAYCTNDVSSFEDPEELRAHTKTEHANDRIKEIDHILPLRVTEIVKLDIHNLECVKCTLPISDWNEMLLHLKNKHAIDLNYAYTKVVPYDLTDELKCALCKQEFTYYLHLDGHMNAHYNNYVCAECGDTFVAETRWRRHLTRHSTERYTCKFCKKVFSALTLKNKHEVVVHNQVPKFKCQYCNERFSGEYLRHMHLLEKHNEKVTTMTCEYCDKTFTWRPYYRKHKRQHFGKKFDCKECGRKFFTQIELKEHISRHIGEKPFGCGICKKQYVSLYCLKRHISRSPAHNYKKSS